MSIHTRVNPSNSLIRRIKRHSGVTAMFRPANPTSSHLNSGFSTSNTATSRFTRHPVQRAVLLPPSSAIPLGQVVGYPPIKGLSIKGQELSIRQETGKNLEQSRRSDRVGMERGASLGQQVNKSYRGGPSGPHTEGEEESTAAPIQSTGPGLPAVKPLEMSLPGVQMERQDETGTQDSDWPRLQKIFNAHQHRFTLEEQPQEPPIPPPSKKVAAENIPSQSETRLSRPAIMNIPQKSGQPEKLEGSGGWEDNPALKIQPAPIQANWPVQRSSEGEHPGSGFTPIPEQVVDAGIADEPKEVPRKTVTEPVTHSSIEIIPPLRPRPESLKAPPSSVENKHGREPESPVVQRTSINTQPGITEKTHREVGTEAHFNRPEESYEKLEDVPEPQRNPRMSEYLHAERDAPVVEPRASLTQARRDSINKQGYEDASSLQWVGNAGSGYEESQEIFRPDVKSSTAVQLSPQSEGTHHPGSETTSVKTSIGDLPADLWQILGKEPPQPVVAQAAAPEMIVEPGVKRAVMAAEMPPDEVGPIPVKQNAVQNVMPPLVQRQVDADPHDGVSDQPDIQFEMEYLVDDLDNNEAEIRMDELAIRVYEQIRRRLSVDWERLRRRY